MIKWSGRACKMVRQRHARGANYAILVAFVAAFSVSQSRAQLKTNTAVGPSFGIGCSNSNAGPCTGQATIPDIPPLKPVIPNDEKCLPWVFSAAPTAPLSATTLKVPAKARGDYEKACNASVKNKPDEAERYSRLAIEKFQDYAAAWVMLGVVLDEQHKEQEARDACSRAAAIDAKYLPAYLCMAEFSARKRDWVNLLSLANSALGLNSENEGYGYFYRAMADLYLHNLADAQDSALKAAQIDASHNYLPLYLLLAQIYEAKKDMPAAENELRELLKHHLTREQENAVKQYLAELEAKPAAGPVEKPGGSSKNADGEAHSDEPDEWAILSMADLRKINGSWVPDDIDDTVPPVATGATCSLPTVLDKAGQRIVELLHNADRYTATETIVHEAIDRSGRIGSPATAQFSYLVSYAENRTGYPTVDELRNNGLDLDEVFPNHIATIGTPSLVLIFHPLSVDNFKMDCEGLGTWHGVPAWQVRFEQRADRPNLTYSITINRVTYDVNLRGRAWILADSYQVARLETDLRESVPRIHLRLDHQSVEYRPVEASASHLQLWLPSSTELYMDFLGRRFYRKHSFSDFRIFSVGTQYQVDNPKGSVPDAGPADGPPKGDQDNPR